MTMHITATSHPSLFAALTEMIWSAGGNHRNNPDQGQGNLTVPAHLIQHVAAGEKGCARLTEEQRLIFVDGEETEMQALIDDDPDLAEANILMNHCFEHYDSMTGIWDAGEPETEAT